MGTQQGQIDQIFLSALEMPPERRAAFLQSCSNTKVRQEVEALLVAYDQSGNFLETPIINPQSVTESTENNVDLLIGRTLGDFRICDKLGEGAFGVVYRAEQITLMREVVVKVLHQKHRDNQEVIERFLREARLASRLEHPYTAHIYAFGAENDGLMWTAMEMVHGTPLDKLLRTQGAIELERFVPLLDKICEVVQTAHDAGIIHRDLKPANMMVISRAGRLLPKLLDFGIAKTLEPDTSYINKLQIENNESLNLGEDTSKTTGLLGSTPYMPAEQWENAAQVDTRADIYALGVFAYEMITGKRPFSGGTPTNFYNLYKAHKEQPVPLLEKTFPVALNTVIAKAMAKLPTDRYSSAVEFATAFRTAAGISIEQGVLPQLETRLYEMLLATAPQPLAESVARFGSARSLHQSRERLLSILQVGIRYLGVIALACRAQIGSGNKKDSETVLTLLGKLRSQELNDKEWYKLAEQLCLPFALKRDAYPVPELVSLFFQPSNTQKTDQSKNFESLLELQTTNLLGATEEQVQNELANCLPEITKFLQTISFILDYPIVVKRREHLERWMGKERAAHSIAQTQLQKLQQNRPTLLDSQGRVILSLWPLLQVFEPLAGTREELFFLTGKGRHGAKLVALPTGFERQDETVWEWFQAIFFDDTEESQNDSQTAKPPYLGLMAFTSADADLFFGRERETESFINRLRLQPLLAIIGTSGAGKSSFLQAGVIPELPSNWRAITVRPTVHPVATLIARLKREFGNIDKKLAEKLATDPTVLADYLQHLAEKNNLTILLFVDQFEELFTLCSDLSERQFYASMLAEAASSESMVRIVLALRDDFLVRAKQLPGLRERLTQGLEILTTPAPEDLLRILVAPTQKVGYQFEDENLPKEIVASVADQTGALPLLAFTAAKLWELRDRNFKQLLRKAYQGMGGVGGALAQHAENMLAAMTASQQRLVKEAFRQLITSEGTRSILTRTELIDLLGSSEEAQAVIEKLISARLLVVSEGEQGIEKVEIVHEALLMAWPRLVQWQQEEKENTRLRDQLRTAAKQWEDRGRVKGLLWRDEALTEYQLWRTRYNGKLTSTEEDFANASVSEAQRGIRRTRIVVSAIVISLIAGLLILFQQRQISQANAQRAEANAKRAETNAELERKTSKKFLEEKKRAEESSELAKQEKKRAEEQQQLAENNELEASRQTKLAKQSTYKVQQKVLEVYEDRGRQEILLGNPLVAALYLSEAYRLGKSDPILKYLLAESMRTVDAQLLSLDKHNKEVYLAEFSPDTSKILTLSRDSAKIWQASSGKELINFADYQGGEPSARFSPDGKLLAVAATNNAAQVFNLSNGSLLHSLAEHKKPVISVRFSPDGKQILTTSRDGTTKLWDALTGKLELSLGFLDKEIGSLAEFNPKGDRIITATDGGIRIWNLSGELLANLVGHTAKVNSAVFSRDGRKIVTTSEDNTAKIWDSKTGNLIASLDGHKKNIYWAEFNSRSTKVVTASGDNTAKIWDSKTGNLIASLEGHLDIVNTAHFTKDATKIITASNDFTVKIWDVSSGFALTTLQGHKGSVYSATLSPNGKQILTASSDKTAKLWDAASDKLKLTFEANNAQHLFGLFNKQNTKIVVGDNSGEVKIWDATNNKLLVTLDNPIVGISSAEFNPTNLQLLTVSDGDKVRVWDTSSGKMLFIVDGYTATFSQDGKYIATISKDKNIKILESSSRKLVTSFINNFGLCTSVKFSPDNTKLVTAGNDSVARVWQVSTGKELINFVGHRGVVTSAEFNLTASQIVTSSNDNTAKIWDVSTGKQLLSLENHKGRVLSVHFSPDNTRIITASSDKTAKIWDAATGRELASLQAHRSSVENAIFTGDNRQVITTSNDKSVKIWAVNLETRSAKEISQLVTHLIPFQLDQGRLIPKKLD